MHLKAQAKGIYGFQIGVTCLKQRIPLLWEKARIINNMKSDLVSYDLCVCTRFAFHCYFERIFR